MSIKAVNGLSLGKIKMRPGRATISVGEMRSKLLSEFQLEHNACKIVNSFVFNLRKQEEKDDVKGESIIH